MLHSWNYQLTSLKSKIVLGSKLMICQRKGAGFPKSQVRFRKTQNWSRVLCFAELGWSSIRKIELPQKCHHTVSFLRRNWRESSRISKVDCDICRNKKMFHPPPLELIGSHVIALRVLGTSTKVNMADGGTDKFARKIQPKYSTTDRWDCDLLFPFWMEGRPRRLWLFYFEYLK